jgi:formylglycine-generating enzyme required for sulfatase activity
MLEFSNAGDNLREPTPRDTFAMHMLPRPNHRPFWQLAAALAMTLGALGCGPPPAENAGPQQADRANPVSAERPAAANTPGAVTPSAGTARPANEAQSPTAVAVDKISPPLAKEISNALGMKLVLMPAGEFLMGSPDSDDEADDMEKPRHTVRITRPFYIARYEVTRGQFARFVEAARYQTDAERKPEGGDGYDATGDSSNSRDFSWRNVGLPVTDQHPVVNVSWTDAHLFCNWLSRREGRDYQLPTEAQWEYACRGGTNTRFYFGDDPEDAAAYGNTIDRAAMEQFSTWRGLLAVKASDGHAFLAPVGQYKPNAAGLYDMTGNVYEWCADTYRRKYETSPAVDPVCVEYDDNRVARGGSWCDAAVRGRSAMRAGFSQTCTSTHVGFRVVMIP